MRPQILESAALSVFVLALTVLVACEPEPPEAEEPEPGVVEVLAIYDADANRHLFELSTDEIPSGWTTFRLVNASPVIHFAFVYRYPEGRGVEDSEAHVVPVFQEGMDLINEGRVDAAMEVFGQLPEWFGDVVYTGGAGFVTPGRTAEATVYLEPGTYAVECYVKDEEEIFHTTLGMIEELVVTEEETDVLEPESTLEVSISSEEGIRAPEEVTPGRHVVAVDFLDQTAHEHFLGHDVHVVRLGEDTDLEAVAAWMDWRVPGSLASPAPAVFLGGIHEMPAGQRAYFTVDLSPGDHAWIAEVPNPEGKGMLVPFTVTGEAGS